MHLKAHYLFLLLAIGLAGQPAWAQYTATDSVDSLLLCVEAYYGTNGLLANGRLYRPNHPRAARHPYFAGEDWQTGAVYVKGRPFHALNLKYNLETGQLVLKQELQNGASINVALTEVLVDSFRIGSHFFVNRPLIPGADPGEGFLEQVYADGLSFYCLHKKTFINTYSSRSPFGKFSEPEKSFFIQRNGRLRAVPNRSAFLDVFAPHQKTVKRYMKQQGIRLKRASATQLAHLLDYCDELD